MFKTTQNVKLPEGTYESVKQFNAQLKSEVADSILTIEIKLNKFKQAKNQLLAEKRKTVKEREAEEDQSQEHFTQMQTRKQKYAAMK